MNKPPKAHKLKKGADMAKTRKPPKKQKYVPPLMKVVYSSSSILDDISTLGGDNGGFAIS